MHITMTGLYLIPSFVASIFLASIAIYLLFKKPRRKYIIPIVLLCLANSIWNIGMVLTNVTNGDIIWGELSAVGLIFFPVTIFHFTVEYTKFFKDKYYLLAYLPAALLTIPLLLGYYVTGIDRSLTYGIEPTYEFLLFSVNSWVGFFLVIFSVFILVKYYKESVGIKKRQTLIILFAIPTNAFLSFISYVIMVDVLHVAQFPVGSLLDLVMISLIVYAILRYKLPVETAAEIDFRILAEMASEGICIIDKDGDIEYSNKHFCEMLNIPDKKVLGDSFIHFVSPSFHDEFNDALQKMSNGEKIFGMEIVLERQGDGTIVAEINTAPIIWNDKIIGSFITIRDIEERKRAEEALKESEEKYRTLAEQSMDGIFLAKGYKLVYANSALVSLLGANSFDELKDKNLLEFLQKEDAEKIRKDVEKGLKGEILEGKYELRAKRLDGREIFIDLSMTKVMYEGKPHALGIVRDITEKKEMEEALRESEERYRSIVENSHAGIIIINDKFHVTYINNQLSAMLGYSKEEIIGEDFRKFLDEESRELVGERYKKRREGEDVPSKYEFRVVRKDGEKRDVEASVSLIKDSEGKIKTIGQILDITERKKAENELREAEERYRGIFENAIMGIYQSTPEGRHISVNPKLAEIYGYDSPEDLINSITDIGKQLYVDPNRRAELVHRLMEKGEVSNFESQVYRKDGTIIWISENARTVRDEKGNILYFVGTVEDITNRKKAEDALKESEEKYRTLVENLNIGVYRNTPGEKGKFLEVNSALVRIFGYENKEELLKLNVSDLYYHPEERKKFNEKMLRNGFVKNEEIQLKKKDGTPIWGSVTAKAVKDEHGNVKYYDGIIEDITDRKKAEEELIKQKTYFQALFESSPEAIVSLDEKHRVLDVNPAFVELFGYTVEDLKGRDLDDFVLPEDEKKKGRKLTEKVLNGEIVRSEGLRKKKDGSLVHVSILGAPIFIEGKQVGIYTIYRDITARKEAEQEKEFYDSLLRHDVANRNTIIQGSLELLAEEDLTEEQKAIVENALKASHSSTELIEMIRNLRRIGGEQSFALIDLHEVLSKVVSILEQQAKNKGIEIVYSPIHGIVKAGSLIENAFSNIIQNAIIHSNCSKIIISGKEEKRDGKTFYRISIEDNGRGIPADIRKNIFSIGVKGKGSPGSGLGLYLVKKIIESYGGEIVIREPENGKGTIFDVYLPKFE